MKITGILKVKGQTQVVNDRFTKREFVLTDNSTQYPQHISIQLTQDRCNMIDNVKLGDNITAHFNLRGREWTSPQGEVKYFNTIEAWKIEKAEWVQSEEMPMTNDFESQPAKGADDLPF